MESKDARRSTKEMTVPDTKDKRTIQSLNASLAIHTGTMVRLTIYK